MPNKKVVYTIGTREYYDPDLATGRLVKLGRTARYPGGSVWKTPQEAARHCKPEQSVYEVLADYDTDTEPSMFGNDWHDLLFNSPVLRRIDDIEGEANEF